MIIKGIELLKDHMTITQEHHNEFITRCFLKYPYIDKDIITYLSIAIHGYNSLEQLQFPVLTFRMGLGKTTLLNEYVQYKLETLPYYGAIIAVERIETIKQLCESHREYCGIYGFRKDECIAQQTTYNPNMCRVCKHAECHVKQNEEYSNHARVIVMTHKRLQLLMSDDRILNKYMFMRIGSDRIKRSDLFIDECPGFYYLTKVHDGHVKTFQSALHHTYQKDCKSRRDLLTYFNKMIKVFRTDLTYSDRQIHTPTLHIDEFEAHKEKFVTNYFGNSYQISIDVLNALSMEGIMYNGTKTVPVINQFKNLVFRTFIFDGTATLDATYEKVIKLECPAS